MLLICGWAADMNHRVALWFRLLPEFSPVAYSAMHQRRGLRILRELTELDVTDFPAERLARSFIKLSWFAGELVGTSSSLTAAQKAEAVHDLSLIYFRATPRLAEFDGEYAREIFWRELVRAMADQGSDERVELLLCDLFSIYLHKDSPDWLDWALRSALDEMKHPRAKSLADRKEFGSQE